MDIDFLMRGLDNNLESMDRMIADILAVNTGTDFVSFKASKTIPIARQRKYHGVRTQIIGRIKNIRVPFHVDIGIGDVIFPAAERRVIRTQLHGYRSPVVLTYSLESTIAEKLDAILQRLELTGRMKDFYDLYYLSRTFDFNGGKLQMAIQKTLQTRATPYENNSFIRIMALADVADMQIKWRYFLKTLKDPEIDFKEVIAGIGKFLRPVWEKIISKQTITSNWTASTGSWNG